MSTDEVRTAVLAFGVTNVNADATLACYVHKRLQTKMRGGKSRESNDLRLSPRYHCELLDF
eukprot:13297058-Ditylum_brightwellii.AAC.2